MQFFFADSLDTVDPHFNFITDTSLPGRNRQMEDVFAHEIYDSPPYDGILISHSVVDGSFSSGRYTQGQRQRLLREGAHRFLRLPNDVSIMGDCGAFSYVNMKHPPYSVKEIYEFYETCKFTHAVSPDHIILERNSSWDSSRLRPDYVTSRADYTFQSAVKFIEKHKSRKSTFTPIGSVQSWSPKSAAKYAQKLVDVGYQYIGLGGLAKRPTRDIYNTVTEVRSVIPKDISLHVFGMNRIDRLDEFQGLGITSFDSTSPLIKAFKDDRHNYFSENDDHYIAIRIPPLHETKVKNKIQSGEIDHDKASSLEKQCLDRLHKYNKHKCNTDKALDSIYEYEVYLGSKDDKREQYRKTLVDRPWEKCGCKICKDLGIDALIYRGINRNKRRGYHNLYVFYEKLKQVRSTQVLRVPCLKIPQNLDKSIFSFTVNGKDISKFATISRISRDKDGSLIGYQRPEIDEHINDIKSYLEKKNSILPNSIVVAFNKSLRFEEYEGNGCSGLGTLNIPIGDDKKIGWIVDGQQRAAALRRLDRDNYAVSVIGFESKDVEEEREQFVLVNSTKPLPKSLVYELLPSISNSIPPKLKKRQKAYILLEQLNLEPNSPFYYRIKTTTSRHIDTANIKDMSVLKMIENSSENGILYTFNGQGKRSYKVLCNYWNAVKKYYEEAWDLPPRRSRLTHGVGIVSMGFLMDAIAYRLLDRWEIPPMLSFLKELRKLGEDIPWINGEWRFSKNMILPWNEIQNTNKHIDLVTNYIIRRYRKVN